MWRCRGRDEALWQVTPSLHTGRGVAGLRRGQGAPGTLAMREQGRRVAVPDRSPTVTRGCVGRFWQQG